MKIKFFFLIVLLGTGYNSVASSSIIRAKRMVDSAQDYYKQNLSLLYRFLSGVSVDGTRLDGLARELQRWISEIERLEIEVEKNLISKLTADEQALRKENQKNLRINRIVMNSKVPDDVNHLFSTVVNISENIRKELGDYRRKLGEISPKISIINKKINDLKKQIADLEAEKAALMNSIMPDLKSFYDIMEKVAKRLLNKTNIIGDKIKAIVREEQEQIISLKKTLDKELKKADPKLLSQLKEAEKKRNEVFAQIKNKTNRLSANEMRAYNAIVDLLNHIKLVEKIIMDGPNQIKKWKLSETFMGTKLPWKK